MGLGEMGNWLRNGARRVREQSGNGAWRQVLKEASKETCGSFISCTDLLNSAQGKEAQAKLELAQDVPESELSQEGPNVSPLTQQPACQQEAIWRGGEW